MWKTLLPLIVLGLAGCCCCPRNSYTECKKGCKPALNCMGLAYDGSGSPCYRPPGPFWCCFPGPCSTCRDPWVEYYDATYANGIKRHVCYQSDHERIQDMRGESDSHLSRVVYRDDSDE